MTLLRSSLYETIAQAGADFTQQHGWDLPRVFSSVDEEFRKAESGAAVHDRSHAGRLKATGADCLDLLNRLSTNKVDELEPGQGAPTILTTDQGRIVDLVNVVNTDEYVLMLTSPGTQEEIIEWLDKYTIMDDVEVEDWTQATAMLTLLGPEAGAALDTAATISQQELDSLPAHGSAAASIAGCRVQVVQHSLGPVPGFELVLDRGDAGPVWNALVDAGAAPMGTAAFDVLRVACAVPVHGQEMGQPYNPLEAGLIGSIDFAKGCYIGQEVIARLDTYQKVQKHLVTLRFKDDVQVSPGDSLVHEGRAVGVVTSTGRTPAGESIGMGYVRKAQASPGARLELQEDGWAEISGFSQLFGAGE